MTKMDEKEKNGALLEVPTHFTSIIFKVQLLKELKHPHIVSYKDSFIEDGNLIIIMEYCEG